jgi:hypothetical protein
MPEAAEHLPPPPFRQRVIDRDNERLIGREQPIHDHLRDPEPELIHAPAGVAEEPVRARVMPDRREPAADQHPRHAPQSGLGDLTDHQRPERAKGWFREARLKQLPFRTSRGSYPSPLVESRIEGQALVV